MIVRGLAMRFAGIGLFFSGTGFSLCALDFFESWQKSKSTG
jgi:hypothetical protein